MPHFPSFSTTFTASEFDAWIAASPTEDELRDAYIRLEAKLADLWTPGHLDSFRRDRHELDGVLVDRLVQIKFALATTWVETGQFARFSARPLALA